MQNEIVYNGIIYRKHPHQKYFYSSQSVKKTNKLFSRSLHRQMWFDLYGKIAVGFHIHHIDGNAFNNTIENFEAIQSSWHASYHSKEKVERDPKYFKKLAATGQEFAKEWHASDEGRQWHKLNALNTGFGKMEYGSVNCANCNTNFVKKSSRAKFCSNSCKSAYRRKNNPDKALFNCLSCEKEYLTLKYLPVKYCSKECRPAPNPLGYNARKDLLRAID